MLARMKSGLSVMMCASSMIWVLATGTACDSKPGGAAAPAKDATQVVTSSFSDVKKSVQITVPKGYGYCAIPGCGRIEGPVPADACASKDISSHCHLSLVAERPEDFLPYYMIDSGTMPANGDTYNYSDATWTCKGGECTGVQDNRKSSTLDVARAISVGDGHAIIVSGRMMMVSHADAPKMRTVMESVLETATVTATKP